MPIGESRHEVREKPNGKSGKKNGKREEDCV